MELNQHACKVYLVGAVVGLLGVEPGLVRTSGVVPVKGPRTNPGYLPFLHKGDGTDRLSNPVIFKQRNLLVAPIQTTSKFYYTAGSGSFPSSSVIGGNFSKTAISFGQASGEISSSSGF